MLNVHNEFGGQTAVTDRSVSLAASRQCLGLSSTVHSLFCYFSPFAVIALRLCRLLQKGRCSLNQNEEWSFAGAKAASSCMRRHDGMIKR